MTFNEFVNDQVSRLEAIPEFQMGDGGRKELAAWLMEVSGGNRMSKMVYSGAAHWLREHGGAQRIKAVIDECVEFTAPPGLADVKAVWYRMHPPQSSHARCEACRGTGYVIVERGGIEGAAKCKGAGL